MISTMRNYLTEFISLNPQCRKFLLLYFFRSYSSGIVFYIAIYLAHINLNASLIGYEISSLVLGNLLGALLASQVLTNQNSFFLSGISLLIQGSSFLCISLFNSTFILSISVFFLGFFGYLYKVSSNFLITALSGIDKDSRSKAVTFISVSANLGLGLGGMSVSLFSENYPTLLFCSTGFLLLFASVPYFRNIIMLNKAIQHNTNDSEEYNFKVMTFGLITIFLLGIIFAQQRVGLGIFLEEHYSGYGISTIILINTLMIIFILPLLRTRLIKPASIKMMGLGALCLGLGMFGLRYFSGFYIVIMLCVVWTFGEMVSVNISQLICFQFAQKEKRGKAMGIYKFLYALGTFMGAIYGASILKNHPLQSIWSICGGLGIIVFIASLILENKDKKLFFTTNPRTL